jgi:phosphomannomutase
MERPEPIPQHRRGFEENGRVGADVLIVTDGDADRLGIGDEKGNFINQLQAYALLALYLLEVRQQRGAIVKTLSTTGMLEKIGKLYDVPVHQTGCRLQICRSQDDRDRCDDRR